MLRRSLLILLLIVTQGASSWGAPAAVDEAIAYRAAATAFNDGLFEWAERQLSEFVVRFPNSERVPEVILLQAQARFKLGRYGEVLELLHANLARAKQLEDQYHYWMAEANFGRGDYAAAAALYAQLIKAFPESLLLSNASYGEAMAWYKMGNLTNALARLRQSDGAFQKAAQALPSDPYVIRGFLLMGEVLLRQQQYGPAAQTLRTLAQNRSLPPQLEWERQFLLVRAELEGRQVEAATRDLAGLSKAAAASGSVTNQAETVLLQGRVFEAAQRPEAALQVYRQNLALLPPPQHRLALLHMAELELSLNRRPAAIQSLESLLAQHPQANDLDHVRLTLGELYLQQYYALPPATPATNSTGGLGGRPLALHQALTNFDLLIGASPKSPWLGQAYLDRGWCYWEATNLADSLAAFQEATARLPAGTNQALARFKWADTQFQLHDFAGAATNYWLVAQQAAGLTNFPPALLEQTYYQIIRVGTSMEPPDLVGASNALAQIAQRFPNSPYGDRSLLTVGQSLSRQGKTPAARHKYAEEARRKYHELLRRFLRTALKPEVELAIARSYVHETNWTQAIGEYERWLQHYANDPALPNVAFELAWANDQAGHETNAFQLLTNYVARFPESPLAATAQFWVGNFFLNQGDYAQAEKNYQRVYEMTNRLGSVLSYQARLAAGRAAYLGQRPNNATNHFAQLINLLVNDTNSPPSLLAETYIALGDTFLSMASPPGETNKLNWFSEAINAFNRVPATNELAPLAWGRIADCHRQLLSQDAKRFDGATNYYWMVITNTVADAQTRSDAEVGLAEVFRAQAQTSKNRADQNAWHQRALEHYLNVVYEANLRPGEKPDLFWLPTAGQEAADILEAQERWEELSRLCQRLQTVLPGSAAAFQKKLDLAKKHLGF